MKKHLTPLKATPCPWCSGNGRIRVPDFWDGLPGSVITIDFEDCNKCEGSGVIAFKPLKEIKDE